MGSAERAAGCSGEPAPRPSGAGRDGRWNSKGGLVSAMTWSGIYLAVRLALVDRGPTTEALILLVFLGFPLYNIEIRIDDRRKSICEFD